MSDQAMTVDETRARNRKAVDTFLAGPDQGVDPWWVPGSPTLSVLADDFVFEIPWSPRGMKKVYRGEEITSFWEFLGKSILGEYRVLSERVYATDDPATFIFEDDSECQVTWGGGGRYRNRHITLVRCNAEGKICLYREYFNPLYHWPEVMVDAGDGDTFDYNGERRRAGLDPVALTWEETHCMPALAPWTVPEFAEPVDEVRARNRRSVDRFLGNEEGVDPWFVPGSPAVDALAEDYILEHPFAPRGMPKQYRGEKIAAFHALMGRTVEDYACTKEYFWATDDPYTFIAEDEGRGPVTWGEGGIFRNRHVTLYRCDSAGKICLYREYFNPQYHWPEPMVDASDDDTFDYNRERERVGLDPVSLTREETHHMPELD